MRRNAALFALGDANQAVAGYGDSLCGFNDITEIDESRQMLRRHGRIVGGDRDFDQGSELLRREELGRVNGHLLLAINAGHSPASRNAFGLSANRIADDTNIYFQKLLNVTLVYKAPQP